MEVPPDAPIPGPSKSPYPCIEEAALSGVNNGKRADIPRGPARYQRRIGLCQRILEPLLEERLNQRVASVAIGSSSDRVAPARNCDHEGVAGMVSPGTTMSCIVT